MAMKLGKYEIETPAICGSVIGKDVSSMNARIDLALEQDADIIELRLDKLQNLKSWQSLLREDVPTIVTNRTKSEGGYFQGGDRERIENLLEFIDLGVSCIDIEISTPPKQLNKVLNRVKGSDTSFLASYHDFNEVPSIETLTDISQKMVDKECDLAKIIGFAKEPADALRMLDFLLWATEELEVPMIAWAMGEAGKFTRLAAPILDSPIVYAAVGEEAAPGQLDILTVKRLLQTIIPET